jgi:DNA-binding transcriptional MerR regulator
VFEILAHDKDQHLNSECGFPLHDLSERLSDSEIDSTQDYSAEEIKRAAEESEEKFKEVKKNLYDAQKRRSTLVLTRNEFMDAVCDAMSEYWYFGPNQRNDFALACK